MFNRINAWFHLWIGIASGLVVFILGITGCILVFEQEIIQLTRPWTNAEKPDPQASYLPPSVLYKSVTETLPGQDVHSIWYHGESRAAHMSAGGDSVIWVNPYTAKVTAVANSEDFFHFIDEGHRHLWLPRDLGRALTGWGTLIFFLLLISGIILWWPKKWNKRNIDQSFKIRWRGKFKRVNYDLHNVLGFYSLVVCIVFAFTGLMMSFSWFHQSVFWLAGGQLKERVEAVSDTSRAGNTVMMQHVDKAWEKGMNEIGQFNKDAVIVHFPDEPKEAIYVCVDMYAGTWRDVYLDQYTLEELPASNKRLTDERTGNWLSRMNYGLHVGEVGGLTTKIIYFLASLICASLPVTGFLVWWGRRRKKPKRKEKPLRKEVVAGAV